jgi:ribosome-binding factor A
MKAPSKRSRRVADLMQREVSAIIHRNIVDPRLAGLTITLVDMSPDLKNAKILFTVQDDLPVADAEKALLKASGFIRSKLAKASELRHVPKLVFVYDKDLLRAAKLSSLIDQVAPESDE